MVSGLTKKEAQTGRDSLRLRAASSRRSPGCKRGRAGLALEDAKLMAEKEYLGLEAGLGAAADNEEIEEQAEQAVEQGQEHDLASSQARLLAQISCRSEFLHPTRRVTIRVPAMFAEQMEVRARAFGRSLNVEYGQAIEAWCGGGFGWASLLIKAEDVHEWVTADLVHSQQWAPTIVEPLEMPAGTYIGLKLAGYMLALDRSWFRSDDAFERTRAPLANGLPLVAESGAAWTGDSQPSTVFVYGRPTGTEQPQHIPPAGAKCKKIGCTDAATEYLVLTHFGRDKLSSGIAVPVCGRHATETRNRIRQGMTSFAVE